MYQRKRFLLLTITLLLCLFPLAYFSKTPVTLAEPHSQGNTTKNFEDVWAADASPLAINITLDENNAVSQLISVSGGELSTRASDGSIFTLTIPPQALLFDTVITMTPITAIADLPMSGGTVAAVKLEPDGLQLYDWARLSIVPETTISTEDQIMFGFEGEGEDVHLALAEDTEAITLLLDGFSGAGVGSGIDADRAAILLRNASRNETRLTSQAAAILQNARAGKGDMSELANLYTTYRDLVVRPRILAAESSCDNGRLAIDTALGFERQRQLLGLSDENDGFLSELGELLVRVARKCVEEDYQRCVDEHDFVTIFRNAIGIERQFQLLGMGALSPEATIFSDLVIEKLIRECYHFELEFDSFTSITNEEGLFESTVEAMVPIDLGDTVFVGDWRLDLNGTGVLDSVAFAVALVGCTTDEPTHEDGVFEVRGLNFAIGEGTAVDRITLDYFPGETAESFVITSCEGEAFRFPTPVVPWWLNAFYRTHLNECVGQTGRDPNVDGCFVVSEWQIANGQELLASRSYSLATNAEESDMTDDSELRLYHRPKPLEEFADELEVLKQAWN